MELKATSLGKRLAQHPYDRVVILNAGVKVSGDRHEYLIPLISCWQSSASVAWYGANWNLFSQIIKSFVCTVLNGMKLSAFISI
jgi:hypothetical protein